MAPDVPQHAIRDGDYRLIYVTGAKGLYKMFPDAAQIVMFKPVAAGEQGYMAGYLGYGVDSPPVTSLDTLVTSSTAAKILGLWQTQAAALVIDTGVLPLPDGPVSARYWRVVETVTRLAMGMDSFWAVHTLEIHSAGGNQALAANGASFSSSGGYIGQSTTSAFDGNDDTSWMSWHNTSELDIWIGTDLGAVKSITSFRLRQSNIRAVMGWKIQSSDDNVSWTDRYVHSGSETSGNVVLPVGWETLAFNDGAWSQAVVQATANAASVYEGTLPIAYRHYNASTPANDTEENLIRQRFILGPGTITSAKISVRVEDRLIAGYVNGNHFGAATAPAVGAAVNELIVDLNPAWLVVDDTNVIALHVANETGVTMWADYKLEITQDQ